VPFLNFTFENTDSDQAFTVTDQKDNSRNPIFNGPVNHGSESPSIQCWQGSDGNGRVLISGNASVGQYFDIRTDNDEVRY
jgi:hypothetical protein